MFLYLKISHSVHEKEKMNKVKMPMKATEIHFVIDVFFTLSQILKLKSLVKEDRYATTAQHSHTPENSDLRVG